MKVDRLKCFDLARAFCMLWIVGIWHFQAYLEHMFIYENQYTNCITAGVLVTFTFISGFFLGGGISNFKDVITFYKKRLIRFYPLYFLSCLSLYFVNVFKPEINFISGFKQLILSLTGFSCFCGEMPKTLWYICMLMVFYLITPLLTYQTNLAKRLIFACFLYGLVLISYHFGNTDYRLVIYAPVYLVAVCYSSAVKINEKPNPYLIAIFLICSCVFTFIVGAYNDGFMLHLLPAIFISLTIVEICKAIVYEPITKVLQFISYGSMCAYLFHRQYYGLAKIIFGDFSRLLAYVFILPSFLAICYFMQKMYNHCINGIAVLNQDYTREA